MKLGEIVEILINIRDEYNFSRKQDAAVCAACNILAELPNMAEDSDIRAALDHICHKPRR